MQKSYFEALDEQRKRYFRILSNEFPDFLNDYIATEEMQRLDYINQICGIYWKKENIYENMYSVLKHSVAVALIIWNFTRDKKQTIAGLLHDISTPVFKHCIDFLQGDAEKQESTEEPTYDIIKNSEKIMSLLKRDNIDIEEVYDYKIYPIADNNTPKLSADRLEYTFMNGLYNKKVWDLEIIEEIYKDLKVLKNEEGMEELGFQNEDIAEKFIQGASQLWPIWICSEDTLTMYFFADLIKRLYSNGDITKEDFYKKSEEQVIELIKNNKDRNMSENFEKFMNSHEIINSEIFEPELFCVSRKVKRRYINPLINSQRGYEKSKKIKEKIDNYLNLKISKYACFKF